MARSFRLPSSGRALRRFLLVCLAPLLPLPGVQAQIYEIVEIPVGPPGTNISPPSINDLGEIVGSRGAPGRDGWHTRWRDDGSPISPVAVYPPTLLNPSFNNLSFLGIDRAGRALGLAYDSTGLATRDQDLARLSSGVLQRYEAFNRKGLLAGPSPLGWFVERNLDATGSGAIRARSMDGRVFPLDLPASFPTRALAEVTGVNDQGTAVGSIYDPDLDGPTSRGRGYIWTGGVRADFAAHAGYGGALRIFPVRINNAGEVAGYLAPVAASDQSPKQAFVYLPRAAYGLGSGIHILGSGAPTPTIYALNNNGVVLWTTNGNGQFETLVWSAGTSLPITQLVPPDAPIIPRIGWALNDRGWIVGHGYPPGVTSGLFRAFAMRPAMTLDVTVSDSRPALDDVITATATARNLTSRDLTLVSLLGIRLQGDLIFELVGGQMPGNSVPIPAKGEASFTYQLRAITNGSARLYTQVRGVADDGSRATSRVAYSEPVRVQVKGDLLIKRADEPDSLFAHDDEYQSNPAGRQVRKQTVKIGEQAVFNVRLQNDEATPRSYSLTVRETADDGWSYKYFSAGNDITAQMQTTGATFPELAPGAFHLLTVEIEPGVAMLATSARTLLLLADPSDPGTVLDVVEATGELAFEIVVNSTGDQSDADPADAFPDVDLTKPGLQTTLRCAIEFANRREGKDLITFQIPDTDPDYRNGTPLISLGPSASSEITDSVIIDGWSQDPGREFPPVRIRKSGPALVFRESGALFDLLNGGGSGLQSGLDIKAPGCEIRGLEIAKSQLCGIRLHPGADHTIIQGNHIGIEERGTLASPNGEPGKVDSDFQDQLLGAGIAVESHSNLIGGASPRLRNLVSGLAHNDPQGPKWWYKEGVWPPGIVLTGLTAFNNVIEGNWIGLAADGTIPRTNVSRQGHPTDPFGPLAGVLIAHGARSNRVGGSAPGAANYIAYNVSGVRIHRASANQVAGNVFSRVRPDGTEYGDLEFVAAHGIIIRDAPGNIIGGPSPAEGNAIDGVEAGVVITGKLSTGNLVQHNRIGLDRFGSSSGIRSPIIVAEAPGTRVLDNQVTGGFDGIAMRRPIDALVRRNRVAESKRGIAVTNTDEDPSTTTWATLVENELLDNHFGILVSDRDGYGRTTMIRNLISRSAGLALSLTATETPTRNDFGDPDAGANTLLNYPVLNQPLLEGPDAVFPGSLGTSIGIRTFRIEFFASKAHGSGLGEAQRYLGFLDTQTGISGEAAFRFATPSSNLEPGEFITATATDPEGNTSELCQAVQFFGAGTLDPPNRGGGGGAGGGTGDGNGDGIPDRNQAHVNSLPAASGQWLTVETAPGASLTNLRTQSALALSDTPPPVVFPHGLLGYRVTALAPGATATLTTILHDGMRADAIAAVWAFGPSPENPSPHWYRLAFTVQGSDAIRIASTDGGPGDHDRTRNGQLTVLYGLALAPPPPVPFSIATRSELFENQVRLVVIDGNPVFEVADLPGVVTTLAWPAEVNAFLESAESLGPHADWQFVPTLPRIVEGFNIVNHVSFTRTRFYRLR